ncbi:MAG: hypothetical protein H6642_13115 [Caldilineaceae bacterium]|nr:hypothetical protein [Caldilineaceae bacterium]
MNMRNFVITILTILLIGSVLVGVANMTPAEAAAGSRVEAVRSGLANVRAFAPAPAADADALAVDSGALYRQDGDRWLLVETPADVIVNAVVTASATPDLIYIGAANELAVYRTQDGGVSWLRVPMTNATTPNLVGGVTGLALDESRRILYAGTDTAGLFRLRDVGSSMILSGHEPLTEPVIELAAGADGLAFARTASTLYRADEGGLTWNSVDNLGSTATALAMSTDAVYVGTVDRGLLTSRDGMTWTAANAGLGFAPGSRLQIDALAVDPQQPDVIYAATSYLFGSTTVHQTPAAVSMSTDGAAVWMPVQTLDGAAVAELLPLAGRTGGVYALMSNSRMPVAMGIAPEMATTTLAVTPAEAAVESAAPLLPAASWPAWLLALLAAAALFYVLVTDFGRPRPLFEGSLAPSLARK